MSALTLHIEGMSCGHCLQAVRGVLDRMEGVRVESVQMGRADLQYEEDQITPEAIAAAVSGDGYPATVVSG